MTDVELQFTPTINVGEDLRAKVARAFESAGLPVARWTTPAGEDRSPSGVRWADPALTVRVREDQQAAPADILGGELLMRLKVAAAAVRRSCPRLPLGIEIVTPAESVRLSFRPDASTQDLQTALDQLPERLAPSLGWDQGKGGWISL